MLQAEKTELVPVPAGKEVYAMAPLLIADPRLRDWEKRPEWHTFYVDAVKGRSMGVQGIVTDIWQGLAHLHGTGSHAEWAVNDQTFRIIRDAHLKAGVVLSTHGAGENVADNFFIDIAPQVKAKIGGMVRLRQISLKVPSEATADVKEGIRKTLAQIAEGASPENFEELAKRHSQDPHGPSGGNLGWVKRGTLEFGKEEALNRLRPGQISAPIETSTGFSVLQLVEVDEKNPDLAYVSETGARNGSLVSIWGLSYVIEDYKDFWRDFRDHYSKSHDFDVENFFSELIISAGSAGELRLPSYDEHDRKKGFKHEADWPGRGLLQISSLLAQESLRKAMREKYGTIEKLNIAWKLSDRPFASWEAFSALTTKEEVDGFLRRSGQYTQMGQDIFGWQHASLLEYGYQLLKAAIEVFHEPGSRFARVPIGIKIPGIYWSFFDRFPQLAAGLISTEGSFDNALLPILERQPGDWKEANGNGYAGFFQMLSRLKKEFPSSELFPIFTCAEKDDCRTQCLKSIGDAACPCLQNGLTRAEYSGARTLARGFVKLGERFRQNVKLENAMAGGLYHPQGRWNIVELLREPYAKGINFLRLGDVVSPHNPEMAHAIRQIHDSNTPPCPRELLKQALPAEA